MSETHDPAVTAGGHVVCPACAAPQRRYAELLDEQRRLPDERQRLWDLLGQNADRRDECRRLLGAAAERHLALARQEGGRA